MQPSLLATELTVNCIVQSPSLSSLISMRQSSILVGLVVRSSARAQTLEL